MHPPCEGRKCRGEDLRKFYAQHPAESGKITLSWLFKACRGWKGKTPFFNDYFNKLAGNSTLQKQIKAGIPEKEIRESWNEGINAFKKIRAKYLLY